MANRGLPVNVNGSWNMGVPYAKVGGSWKAINFAYVNVNGTWKQSWANFNKATGGSVKDVTNYNGTGQTWRVHTFTAGSHTFTVEIANFPFKVLLAGGGGGNGGGVSYGGGGGGGFNNYETSLSVGNHGISVGSAQQNTSAFGRTMIRGGHGTNHGSWQNGGSGGSGGGAGGTGSSGPPHGISGGAGTSGQGHSGAGTQMAGGRGGGGGGGAGGNGGGTGNVNGGGGGAPAYSDITGSRRPYCAGSGGGGSDWPSRGGSGGTPASDYGRANQAGVVIVAYQIG